MKIVLLILFIVTIFLISCDIELDNNLNQKEFKMHKFSKEEIDKLAAMRIYFGHMSVGYNILEGLEDLIKQDTIFNSLSVFEIKHNINLTKPGIYHKKNGQNSYPESKCNAFVDFLIKDSLGNQFDIAFFKFCYVDINKDSNVEEIFDYYVHSIEKIKKIYPDLKIIHVTIPLFVHNYGFKSMIKNFIRGDIANIKRNQFNKMLIDKYKSEELIYDLAFSESTYPDGKRETFTDDVNIYYSLIKDYTYDGGHLNQLGRQKAAREMLKSLLKLSAIK